MAYEQSSRRNTLILLLVGALALGTAMIWLVSERVRFDDTPRIQEIGVISPEHSEETHASVIAKGVPEPQPVGDTPVVEVAPETTPAPRNVAAARSKIEEALAPDIAESAGRPEVAQSEDALIAPIAGEARTDERLVANAAADDASGEGLTKAPRAALNDPFEAVGTQVIETPNAPSEEATGIDVAAVSQEALAAEATPKSALPQEGAEAEPLVDATSQPVTIDDTAPANPTFDLVRLEADGSGIIAGRAEPGAEVQVVAGGAPLAKVLANDAGEFVAFLDPNSAAPSQNIELISAVDGGPLVRSDSSIVVLERVVEAIKGPADPVAQEPASVGPVDAAASTALVSENAEQDGAALPEGDQLASVAPQDAANTASARPRAQISAPVIANTTEGIRIVQPVMIAPDQVSLDTISYDDAGEVVITGRAQPGGEVWLYVDQTRAAEVPVSDGGTWETTLAGISEGRYLLRADEVSPEGKVFSRAESPFQRQFPSPENLALLTSEKEVIVQPGANLWNIAKLRYGEGIKYWVIFDANDGQIRDPDLIYPGQIFTLPDTQ